MRYIKSSFQFIKESKENSILVEFGEKFQSLNKEIFDVSQDPIAKYLIESEITSDITLVNWVEGKNDVVSFIQSNRYNKNISDFGEVEGIKISNEKGRTELKIGRLLRKILPVEFTAKQIETYVNLYKSSAEGDVYQNYFSIVNGEDVIKYYHKSKYLSQTGSLGNSCMKEAEYLSLYEINKDVVSMLILKSPNTDLIIGRALVWKLSIPENTYFMDRIYTTSDYLIDSFKTYAIKKNWLSKNRQSHSDTGIFDPATNDIESTKLVVKVLPEYYENYPYMDTLRYYYKSEGIITNKTTDVIRDEYGVSNPVQRIMRNTSGDADGDKVYDDDRGVDIYTEDACYCKDEGEWTSKDNAVWVEDIKSFVYKRNLVESKYHGRMVFKPNCAFVESIQDWVLKKELLRVYTSGNNSTYVLKDRIGETIEDAFGNRRFASECEGIVVGKETVYFDSGDMVDCYEINGCWFLEESDIPSDMVGDVKKSKIYKEMINFGRVNVMDYYLYRNMYLVRNDLNLFVDDEYIKMLKLYRQASAYKDFLEYNERDILSYLTLKRNNYIEFNILEKDEYPKSPIYIEALKRYVARNYSMTQARIVCVAIDNVYNRNSSDNYLSFIDSCVEEIQNSATNTNSANSLLSDWRSCTHSALVNMDDYVGYSRNLKKILSNLNEKYDVNP